MGCAESQEESNPNNKKSRSRNNSNTTSSSFVVVAHHQLPKRPSNSFQSTVTSSSHPESNNKPDSPGGVGVGVGNHSGSSSRSATLKHPFDAGGARNVSTSRGSVDSTGKFCQTSLQQTPTSSSAVFVHFPAPLPPPGTPTVQQQGATNINNCSSRDVSSYSSGTIPSPRVGCHAPPALYSGGAISKGGPHEEGNIVTTTTPQLQQQQQQQQRRPPPVAVTTSTSSHHHHQTPVVNNQHQTQQGAATQPITGDNPLTTPRPRVKVISRHASSPFLSDPPIQSAQDYMHLIRTASGSKKMFVAPSAVLPLTARERLEEQQRQQLSDQPLGFVNFHRYSPVEKIEARCPQRDNGWVSSSVCSEDSAGDDGKKTTSSRSAFHPHIRGDAFGDEEDGDEEDEDEESNKMRQQHEGVEDGENNDSDISDVDFDATPRMTFADGVIDVPYSSARTDNRRRSDSHDSSQGGGGSARCLISQTLSPSSVPVPPAASLAIVNANGGVDDMPAPHQYRLPQMVVPQSSSHQVVTLYVQPSQYVAEDGRIPRRSHRIFGGTSASSGDFGSSAMSPSFSMSASLPSPKPNGAARSTSLVTFQEMAWLLTTSSSSPAAAPLNFNNKNNDAPSVEEPQHMQMRNEMTTTHIIDRLAIIPPAAVSAASMTGNSTMPCFEHAESTCVVNVNEGAVKAAATSSSLSSPQAMDLQKSLVLSSSSILTSPVVEGAQAIPLIPSGALHTKQLAKAKVRVINTVMIPPPVVVDLPISSSSADEEASAFCRF